MPVTIPFKKPQVANIKTDTNREKNRELLRNKAKEITEASQAKYEELVTKANDYSSRTRSEADDYNKSTRADADAYNKQVHADADGYSVKTRQDADLYAKNKREEAFVEE